MFEEILGIIHAVLKSPRLLSYELPRRSGLNFHIAGNCLKDALGSSSERVNRSYVAIFEIKLDSRLKLPQRCGFSGNPSSAFWKFRILFFGRHLPSRLRRAIFLPKANEDANKEALEQVTRRLGQRQR